MRRTINIDIVANIASFLTNFRSILTASTGYPAPQLPLLGLYCRSKAAPRQTLNESCGAEVGSFVREAARSLRAQMVIEIAGAPFRIEQRTRLSVA